MTAIHADVTVHVDHDTTVTVHPDEGYGAMLEFGTIDGNASMTIIGADDDIDRVLLSIVQQLDALRAKS